MSQARFISLSWLGKQNLYGSYAIKGLLLEWSRAWEAVVSATGGGPEVTVSQQSGHLERRTSCKVGQRENKLESCLFFTSTPLSKMATGRSGWHVFWAGPLKKLKTGPNLQQPSRMPTDRSAVEGIWNLICSFHLVSPRKEAPIRILSDNPPSLQLTILLRESF